MVWLEKQDKLIAKALGWTERKAMFMGKEVYIQVDPNGIDRGQRVPQYSTNSYAALDAIIAIGTKIKTAMYITPEGIQVWLGGISPIDISGEGKTVRDAFVNAMLDKDGEVEASIKELLK